MLVAIKDVPEDVTILREVTNKEYQLLKDIVEELTGWNPYVSSSIKICKLVPANEREADYEYEGKFYSETE